MTYIGKNFEWMAALPGDRLEVGIYGHLVGIDAHRAGGNIFGNISNQTAREIAQFILDNVPEERGPTFKELWDALPIGAVVPGSPGVPGNWLKVADDKYTLTNYTDGRTFDIHTWGSALDSPPTEGFDFTTRVNVWGDE